MALPVRLISFTGKKVGENNVLNWVTSEENNTSHFEIERSSDVKAFEKIGIVNANYVTKENTKYEFIDYSGSLNPKSEIEYYRLKMVDMDGKYQYSKIINIANNSENELVGQFYPNPSLDNFCQY